MKKRFNGVIRYQICLSVFDLATVYIPVDRVEIEHCLAP